MKPDDVTLAMEPMGERIDEVCGIYFRWWALEKKGQWVPQHAHAYDHATMIVSGAVSLWVHDGETWTHVADYAAPAVIEIKARKVHAFFAQEDNTRICCVHNLNGEPYKTLRLKGEIE